MDAILQVDPRRCCRRWSVGGHVQPTLYLEAVTQRQCRHLHNLSSDILRIYQIATPGSYWLLCIIVQTVLHGSPGVTVTQIDAASQTALIMRATRADKCNHTSHTKIKKGRSETDMSTPSHRSRYAHFTRRPTTVRCILFHIAGLGCCKKVGFERLVPPQ